MQTKCGNQLIGLNGSNLAEEPKKNELVEHIEKNAIWYGLGAAALIIYLITD